MKRHVGIAFAGAAMAAATVGGAGFAATQTQASAVHSAKLCNNLVQNLARTRHRVGTGATPAQNKRLARQADIAEQRYLNQCVF
jgi:hypothetical protein